MGDATTVAVGRALVTCLRFDAAVAAILDLAADNTAASLVVTPNIQHIALLEDDGDFQAAYDAATLAVPDGWPVVAAARLAGAKNAVRVAGSDLLEPLCAGAADRGLTVAVIGGPTGAADLLVQRLRQRLPRLAVVLVDDTPRLLEAPSDVIEDLRTRLRAAHPNLVLLGLGAPRQEVFAARHLLDLPLGAVVCVGAAIAFSAGVESRAPRVLQAVGMEWLHRVGTDPRRLARRYVWAAPRFLRAVRRSRRPRD